MRPSIAAGSRRCSPRALDDVGMTAAERAAILGFEEPARDPWSPVVLHRL